jgi:beta-lactamase regulating signal transducer with metallopeptidase domain
MTGAEIAGAVLNGLIEGLALWALVWLALRLRPRTAAATRYALCGIALAFVAALPVAQSWLPRLAASAPASGGGGYGGGGHAAVVLTLTAGAWLVWAVGLWALGSLLLLGRVGWALMTLSRLKRRAVATPGHVSGRFEEMMRALPGRRRARVLLSRDIAAPVAAGLANPAVLLPARLVEELSGEELRQVLTHELAHIRRWDDWTNLAQKVVEALLFFHPAVIWIGRRLTLEREIACDDWVVGLAGAARPYAACLTRLAALNAVAPQLAPGAAARKPQLSIRVEALLAGTGDRRRRCSKAALVAASAALAVAVFAAVHLAPVSVTLPASTGQVRQAIRHRPQVVESAAAPRSAPARKVAKVARAHRSQLARTPLHPASVPAVMLYVVYFEDGDAGWIGIVWVHQVAVPVLDRT